MDVFMYVFLYVPSFKKDWRLILAQLKISSRFMFPLLSRSSHQRCSVRKGVLRNFAQFIGKHLCQSLFLIKLHGLHRLQETPAQVFSWEFCEIFKNTFSAEHLWTTASEPRVYYLSITITITSDTSPAQVGYM